ITTSSAETGRLLGPGDDNVVVIGNSVANEIFKNKVSINRELVVNDKSYRVVGVLKKSGGFGFDDRKIFMPINPARKTLNNKDNVYDSIIVKVKNSDEIDKVEKIIEDKLMIVRHVNTDTKDFTVLSMKTIQERVSAILAGFTLFLGVIAAVSLIVGAVGIANTMFTSVLERTKDIGIMKAVGAKNSDILLIFLFNSGLVGLVGGLFGIMFGISISLIIPKLGVSFVQGGQSMTTSIDPQLIIFTLIFSTILGMLSGIIPAYRASKLKPVDALRSE
ncbi:ABC transporter permease, partial [Candidatus Woesearchaeota archaeon]|nr:ABC transporter permease [Candidatus Woesearchaeota archaeon]